MCTEHESASLTPLHACDACLKIPPYEQTHTAVQQYNMHVNVPLKWLHWQRNTRMSGGG